MSRDRQARSERVLRFGLASLDALTSSVAEELTDSNFMEWFARRCGPLGVDSSTDFVSSPWARTSVLLLNQLVGPRLPHQGSMIY